MRIGKGCVTRVSSCRTNGTKSLSVSAFRQMVRIAHPLWWSATFFADLIDISDVKLNNITIFHLGSISLHHFASPLQGVPGIWTHKSWDSPLRGLEQLILLIYGTFLYDMCICMSVLFLHFQWQFYSLIRMPICSDTFLSGCSLHLWSFSSATNCVDKLDLCCPH